MNIETITELINQLADKAHSLGELHAMKNVDPKNQEISDAYMSMFIQFYETRDELMRGLRITEE